VPGAAGIWRDLTDNVNELAGNLTSQVRDIGEVAIAVTQGDLSRSIQVEAQGEVELLKDTINEMIRNLRDTTTQNREQDWLKTNLARFTGMLQGQKDLQTVGKMVLSELAPLVDAQHGVFYLNTPVDDQPLLRILASYAFRERKHLSQHFRVGEGLVGECAYEKEMILLTNVPSDYIEISSGLGAAPPLNIVVLPVLFEGEIKAVIELASFNRFSAVHLSFLQQLTESIGIVLNTLEANSRTEELLKQSQALTLELRTRQQELQQTNEELGEKARLLAEQNAEVERRRREIDEARGALEQKADQLALTSKYKSQFLANMSHELRTPLNSLLILAQQLAENADGNLSSKQVQFADTIYSSGVDLLTLINDILDLTKIESGTTSIDAGEASFADVRDAIERTFRAVADEKGLAFRIELDSNLPPSMVTDGTRLHQVLKNLLSNAFKFTERGGVTLSIGRAEGVGQTANQTRAEVDNALVAFAVRDTGIGIPADKLAIIFEPFQQADMATSRKFGGTGLGLSISREIAHLLGGQLTVESVPDEGSTFTLYLPLVHRPARASARSQELVQAPGVRGTSVLADAGNGHAGHQPLPLTDEARDERAARALADGETAERVLLVLAEDEDLAQVLRATAQEYGFKAIVAADADIAVALANRLRPDAITVDATSTAGWWVLDHLKHDPRTRHIPVQVITAEQAGRRRALDRGAIAHASVPLTVESLGAAFEELAQFVRRETRTLLVVAGDGARRQVIVEVIGAGGVQMTDVGSSTEALAALEAGRFDCLVLDPDLPDMSGFQFLRALAARAQEGQATGPIVLYSARDLTRKEEMQLRTLSEVLVLARAASPERLLDAVALFLHRAEAALPEAQRLMLQQARRMDLALTGKKVLIVDDDMRNIFALTSALERYGMDVAFAETGQGGIDLLAARPDIDVVLMDIMLPEMDGYETIRRIRAMAGYETRPLIALTAKAMSGDREKCLAAGASDYISKPVDVGQLLSLLRVWLDQAVAQ
jgi:signal transduction histidine kinase/DNA-binding response OmpR family regulator/HAMP domain-containing protein